MEIRFLLHNVYSHGGGVLTATFNLARDLAERHDVEIVSVLQTEDEPSLPLPASVPLRNLVDPRRGMEPLSVRGLVREVALRCPTQVIDKVDRRHARHSLYTDVHLVRYLRSIHDGVLVGMQPGISLALARLARPSVLRVAQEHRPLVSRPQALRTVAARHYPRLDMLFTLTERDAEDYRGILGHSTPVLALPNGAPVYDGAISDQQAKVVVAAGQLRYGKGFDRLLTAWARVVQKYPDWQLRIYGEGPEEVALQAQIEELKVQGSAQLMGYSSVLLQEMARASVFAMSSRFEGYPMVLLEAMSCGLPVVSVDCPTGPREIISPDQDGFLVPDRDEALADALIRMIDLGPERRRELGAAARAKALDNSPGAVADRWEQLLEQQLAAKS